MSNRYSRDWPKIGIRPIIDGRRKGIRESMEAQTMAMALSVVKLYTEQLRYPDGSPVQCVIADTSIGGVAEAVACADKFSQAGVGLTLSVTSCWCYGTETIDMNPVMPKAIWGFNGTERPGAVYLAAALAGHNQKGLPVFGIYGQNVQDADDRTIPEDVQEKLLQFAKAGMAVAIMQGTAYLSMGSVAMGIAGSIVNADFFQDYLGMRNEYIDSCEFIRRIEEKIYDQAEYEKALSWVKANCKEGPDRNPPSVQVSRERKDQDWEISIKLALIAKDLMIGNPKLAEMGYVEESMGHQALVAGFQGQRQWTDHFANGDFMEAILNSSFDWNGLRAPFLLATENDSLNGVAMLFGYLLTNRAQVFADVRTFWSPEAVKRVSNHDLVGPAACGIIHLINSGAAALDGCGQQTRAGLPVMKPFWEISEEEKQKCLDATAWRPAMREYFRGGGYSSNFLTKGGMPVTMIRVNLIKGLGPVLQLAEGYTVDLPDQVNQILNDRTDPTWPTTWFAPILTGADAFSDVYSVMNNWGANHAAFSYGHIGADLIALASLLRIPVCMHNVAEKRIFRPSAWSAFGTSNREGADFRACQNFGPLYGRNK